MTDSFNSGRLSLNLLNADDHEFMQRLVNSAGWLRFIGNRGVNSKEEAIRYIQKIQHTPGMTYWVVKISSDDTPIGIVSLIKRDYLEHFDIGFAFLPEFNGKGYALEATGTLLSKLRHQPTYEKILATTRPKNVSSIKLLKKLGMHFDHAIEIGTEKLHIYST
jgi:ribosomal-protein-alanine N-acetyltransferase